MKKSKKITGFILLTGITLVVLSLFAFKGPLLERWHLYRLQSEDESIRSTALAYLVEKNSPRLTPRLIEVLIESRVETGGVYFHRAPLRPYSRDISSPSRIYLTKFPLALWTVNRERTTELQKEIVKALRKTQDANLKPLYEAWKLLTDSNKDRIKYPDQRYVAEIVLHKNCKPGILGLAALLDALIFQNPVTEMEFDEIVADRFNTNKFRQLRGWRHLEVIR